ncbi:MAG: hypothetical protein ACK5HR_03605 [Mycoplasmatales bacterium]
MVDDQKIIAALKKVKSDNDEYIRRNEILKQEIAKLKEDNKKLEEEVIKVSNK